jgi:hypothetical protein
VEAVVKIGTVSTPFANAGAPNEITPPGTGVAVGNGVGDGLGVGQGGLTDGGDVVNEQGGGEEGGKGKQGGLDGGESGQDGCELEFGKHRIRTPASSASTSTVTFGPLLKSSP